MPKIYTIRKTVTQEAFNHIWNSLPEALRQLDDDPDGWVAMTFPVDSTVQVRIRVNPWGETDPDEMEIWIDQANEMASRQKPAGEGVRP